MLPTIANHIREGLQDSESQYQNLLQAREKPYVLDDDIVNRVVEVYTTQREDFWLYEEQVARWKKEMLTPHQRREIEMLSQQLQQLRQVNGDILSLADELKEGTINRILEKDDAELGLEVLMGKWKV